MAAEYDHLPVYKAAYDLLQHVYRDKCIASVPRDVKYTLVERLKQDILEVLVLIYKAHYNMLGDQGPAIAAGARADTGRQGPHADHVRLAVYQSGVVPDIGRRGGVGFQTVGRLAHQDFAAQDRRSSGSGPDCGCGFRCGFCTRGPVCGSDDGCGSDCGFRCGNRRLPCRGPVCGSCCGSVAASCPRTVCGPGPCGNPPAPAPRSARTDLFAAPAPAAAAPFPAPDPLASPAPEAPWAAPGEDNE